MNDTDTYDARHRVGYRPDPRRLHTRTHPSDPKGQRPRTGLRRGGEPA